MANSTEHVLRRLLQEWSSALAWQMQLAFSEMAFVELSSDGNNLDVSQVRSPLFSRSLPGCDALHSRRWLGDRLFCFLNGAPQKRRIAPVSSRLKQRLDLEAWWFDLLRTLILRCDAAEDSIVVVESTAPFSAASRAARLFGRTLLRFELPSTSHCRCENDICTWLSHCLDLIGTAEDQPPDVTIERVLVSPELCADLTGIEHCDSEFSALPLGDRILFAAADRIQILSCRARGTVSELLHLHLLDPDRIPTPVLMACDEKGLLPNTAKDLPIGWVPWILQPPILPEDSNNQSASVQNSCRFDQPNHDQQKVTAYGGLPLCHNPLQKPDDWLLHWTRATAGPWPGETSEDFLDALILRTEAADHSAVTTLLRILSEGVLRASAEGIRGSYPVVSFTGVPLHEFRQRRVFRKHRHRFDFEPWGIAVRKSCLISLGIRPVLYGDDEDWNLLDSDERRFFQKATSGGATNNSDELEWRAVKDVDLAILPRADVCVFVDSIHAAQMASFHGPWDVIVVPD